MTPIDFRRAQVIIAAHPDECVHYSTLLYLINKGITLPQIVVTNHKKSVVESRNINIARVVVTRLQDYEWFLFLDKDVHLKEGLTCPFFDDVPDHVVGATYDTGNEMSWLVPTFHMGIVRIRAGVFAKLQPPWLAVEYNEDGTELKTCECNYLRRKILEHGFTITNRGRAEHTPSRSWHKSPAAY